MRTSEYLVALTVFGLAGAALAAPADAAPIATQRVDGVQCLGLSPNIVDLPYDGGFLVQTDTNAPGRIAYLNVGGIGSPIRSVFGYVTEATVSWQNLDTGAAGAVTRSYRQGIATENGMQFSGLDTGAGRVRVTVSGVNRGPLLSLPAPACTGEVTI
ncbi:hypothetical protein ACFVMC_11190 [Nocardia sp. NPDC127579]|uniref:hypothetical protein n=1 Tax=Nocardia sp. NPDC127579 TaxID=3345402 RepID=UPI0036435D18